MKLIIIIDERSQLEWLELTQEKAAQILEYLWGKFTSYQLEREDNDNANQSR